MTVRRIAWGIFEPGGVADTSVVAGRGGGKGERLRRVRTTARGSPLRIAGGRRADGREAGTPLPPITAVVCFRAEFDLMAVATGAGANLRWLILNSWLLRLDPPALEHVGLVTGFVVLGNALTSGVIGLRRHRAAELEPLHQLHQPTEYLEQEPRR